MKRHNWRWWFHVIHRDLGYLCVGLVLVYALSGIGVNHIDDWNSNYIIREAHTEIDPVETDGADDDEQARAVLAQLDIPQDWNTLFCPEPGTLHILREGHTVEVVLATGEVRQEWVSKRPVFHEVNRLHHNQHREWWTWIADIFAGALIALAITGMFLIKGKKGFTGRGYKLVAAGFVIPFFFLWYYG